MNTVLLILLVMGAIAIGTAAYVFTVAARNYVSTDDQPSLPSAEGSTRPADYHVVRSVPERRRSGQDATFPMVVDGILVKKDRRSGRERRGSASAA